MHSCSHLSALQTGSRDGEDGDFGAAEGKGIVGSDADTDGASGVGCRFVAASSFAIADCSVAAGSFDMADCSVSAGFFNMANCSVSAGSSDMADCSISAGSFGVDCFSISLPRRSGYGIISPAPGCRGEFVCDEPSARTAQEYASRRTGSSSPACTRTQSSRCADYPVRSWKQPSAGAS